MNNLLSDYLKQMGSLPEEEQAALLQLANIKEFQKGTVLLKEGQYARDEYFILKGCLRTYYLVDGAEKTTEFYTEFEPISPICVSTGKPSDYFISCLEDSVLLIANPELNQTAFAQFPQLERLCLQMTERVLAKKQMALHNFKINSPEQRYLNLLDSNPELIQRVPQYQLASYLGIAPQSLSRLRKRLAQK